MRAKESYAQMNIKHNHVTHTQQQRHTGPDDKT